MESNTSTPQAESLSVQARTYFLQQGQSTLKLYGILKSNLLIGFAKWGVSILFEIILFILFLAILFVAFQLGRDFIGFQAQLSENVKFNGSLDIGPLNRAIFMAQIILGVASLAPLAMMYLLRRNRKKRSLIRQAYQEVDMMKERFEDAVKGLKF